MGYWRLLGQYDAETTTFSACAGTPASPYTPDKSGNLRALRIIMGGGAAASLVNHVQFRLTCTTFNPNSIECGATGNGLNTAPAFIPDPVDFACNQAVQAGVPITIEGRNITADTPVTVSVFLYGYFD